LAPNFGVAEYQDASDKDRDIPKFEIVKYPSFITLGRRKGGILAWGNPMLPPGKLIEHPNQIRKTLLQ
jgi:hypothetical protein